MKILLIGAYNGVQGVVGVENSPWKQRGYLAPPLGLYRMKGFLNRFGISVEVFDPDVLEPYKFLKDCASEFDIIGFSPSHLTLEHDLSLMWYAHEKNPQAVLVAGGEEATFNSSQIIKHSPLDCIIFGEGEYPMAEIVNAGLLKESGGCRIGKQKPLRMEDFYSLTVNMNFEEIPYETYWMEMEKGNTNEIETRTIRFYTSSYCPHNCAFCGSKNFLKFSYGKRPHLAMIPWEGLLSMVLRAVEVHPLVRTIFFQDDNFIQGKFGREKVTDFCEKVIEYKKKQILPDSLSFMCQTRVSEVSKELLSLMALAGFRMVSYGVESFSERILEEYQKGITVNQIDNALEWTYQTGMTPFLNIILSSPECVVSDIQITVDKCFEHLHRGAKIGLSMYLLPFLGADIFRKSDLLVQTERTRIPETDFFFDKQVRVLPSEKKTRDFLGKVFERTWQRTWGYSDASIKSEFDLNVLSLLLKEEN